MSSAPDSNCRMEVVPMLTLPRGRLGRPGIYVLAKLGPCMGRSHGTNAAPLRFSRHPS